MNHMRYVTLEIGSHAADSARGFGNGARNRQKPIASSCLSGRCTVQELTNLKSRIRPLIQTSSAKSAAQFPGVSLAPALRRSHQMKSRVQAPMFH
jgi:hypothetical protein